MKHQPMQEYWAVQCACGDFIPLAPVKEDEHTHEIIDFPKEPDEFQATCQFGHAATYVKALVTPWLGPIATPSFRVHPALRSAPPPKA
jgi:hypothetical protein